MSVFNKEDDDDVQLLLNFTVISRCLFYVTDNVTVVCEYEVHRRKSFDQKFAWTEEVYWLWVNKKSFQYTPSVKQNRRIEIKVKLSK